MVCATHTRNNNVVKWGNPRVLAPGVYQAWRAPGQGNIGNDVLHDRTAFRDGETGQRLVYRARCLNRIAGTGPKDTR